MSKLSLRGGRGRYMPLETRFWIQVRKTKSCWLWIGNKGIGGYGRIVVNGVKLKAHRFSWELHYGPIPAGLFVCHKCDNPSCIRPDHLFVGTNNDNRQDSVRKNRHNSGYYVGEDCRFAKLTDAQVAEIRRRWVKGSHGPRGTKALAKEFGVRQSYLIEVLMGRARNQGSGKRRIKP